MEKDIVIGGKWNILGEKYDGDLIFNKSNGGILLSIYYKNSQEFIAWQSKEINIKEITGVTNQQSNCILADCTVVKRHTQNLMTHHIVIVAKSLFFGLKNKKKSTIKFNEINFELSNIFQWSKLNGFEQSFDDAEYRYNLKYKFKEMVSVRIDDNTIVEFSPILGKINGNTLVENITVSQFVSIKIKKDKSAEYGDFFKDLEKVIDLIMIATKKKISIKKIICLDYTKYQVFYEKKDYFKFEMIDSRINYLENDNPSSSIEINNYLFDLPEINKECKLENWFKKYNEYRNIYNLYLLGIKNDVPIEIRFTNLMQALELMHSIKFSRKKKFYKHIETKFMDNKKLIDNIKNNVDQFKSPYIILRSRIIDVLINNFALTSNYDMASKAIDLADILTDSRNYYTHYNSSKKSKAVVKNNLKSSIFILEYLNSCYILEELGFSIEYINKKLENDVHQIISQEMISKIIENER